MDDLGEFERLINGDLPPHREIRQDHPFDRLCRDLRWTAWAITTAVWIGIGWVLLTEGRQLIEWWSWK